MWWVDEVRWNIVECVVRSRYAHLAMRGRTGREAKGKKGRRREERVDQGSGADSPETRYGPYRPLRWKSRYRDITVESRLEAIWRNTTLGLKPAKRVQNRMRIWRVPDTKCTKWTRGVWRAQKGVSKRPKSAHLGLRSWGPRCHRVE